MPQVFIYDVFADEEHLKKYSKKTEKAFKNFKIKYSKEWKLINKAKKIEFNGKNGMLNPNCWSIKTGDKQTKKAWNKFVEIMEDYEGIRKELKIKEKKK